MILCLLMIAQVKGLSIEHEKLAVAQRHAAETKSTTAESGVAAANLVNNIAETAETPETPETGLPQGNHIKRTPTPAPSPTYPPPNAYHTAQYYDNPQKKILRFVLFFFIKVSFIK